MGAFLGSKRRDSYTLKLHQKLEQYPPFVADAGEGVKRVKRRVDVSEAPGKVMLDNECFVNKLR